MSRYHLSKVNDISHLSLGIFVVHTLAPSRSLHSAQRGFFLILHLSGSSGYFSSFIPPPACLFVCQQVIKICLLLPRRSTPVETAAAEPRSWSPLLHADDLNVEKMKNNNPPPTTTTGNCSELNATSGLTFFLSQPPLLWRPNSQMKVSVWFCPVSPIRIRIVMNFHSCGSAAGAVALASHDAVGTGPNDTHHLFNCSGRVVDGWWIAGSNGDRWVTVGVYNETMCP